MSRFSGMFSQFLKLFPRTEFQALVKRSRFAWSLSNLLALLRMNLFTHRDLWVWLDEPYTAPPPVDMPQQEALALG